MSEIVDKVKSAFTYAHTPPVNFPLAGAPVHFQKPLDKDVFTGKKGALGSEHPAVKAEREKREAAAAAAKKAAEAEAAQTKLRLDLGDAKYELERKQETIDKLRTALLIAFGALHAVNKDGEHATALNILYNELF